MKAVTIPEISLYLNHTKFNKDLKMIIISQMKNYKRKLRNTWQMKQMIDMRWKIKKAKYN